MDESELAKTYHRGPPQWISKETANKKVTLKDAEKIERRKQLRWDCFEYH